MTACITAADMTVMGIAAHTLVVAIRVLAGSSARVSCQTAAYSVHTRLGAWGSKMTGAEYEQLVAEYMESCFGDRVLISKQVELGVSIKGTDRHVDLVVEAMNPSYGKMFIECKYQETRGTTEDKLFYSLMDMATLGLHGVVVYGGSGFSTTMCTYLLKQPNAILFEPGHTWQLRAAAHKLIGLVPGPQVHAMDRVDSTASLARQGALVL